MLITALFLVSSMTLRSSKVQIDEPNVSWQQITEKFRLIVLSFLLYNLEVAALYFVNFKNLLRLHNMGLYVFFRPYVRNRVFQRFPEV